MADVYPFGGVDFPHRASYVPDVVPGFIRRWWRSHFSGVTSRERWGYFVWGSVAAIVAIPELWAAVWTGGPWPTISGTVGHLEELWSPTAIFPVVVIVVAAAHALRYAWAERPAVAEVGRTDGGRLIRGKPAEEPMAAERERPSLWGYVYLGGALVCVLVPSVLVAILSTDTTEHTRWILGYVIYGLIAVFCVVLPSLVAYLFGKDAPFPTLFRTIADLESRVHAIGMVILAGLAILLIHLALYPWPAVPHHNPMPKSP
jgi:hypothetical protein